ncbi:uncharacterized protein LOC143019000 [Oratosquilla oratoria]|uniref:uncharacterized protein LOC143019000 n=1 Tax=Oratosquilla oratoria TaxID=337810 RepID=UPI003F775FC8
MGSPISFVAAEVVMQQFEADLLGTVPPSLKLWMRLNNLEPAIQFSMKLEFNRVLPFLGNLVSREGDHLKTSVYRNPTHRDRLLDHDSYHTDCHKRSLIRTFWNRANKICSTTDVVRAEKRHLRNVFRDNGYPNRTVWKWTRTRRSGTQSPNRGHRVTIPYIKGASEEGSGILDGWGYEERGGRRALDLGAEGLD